MSLYHRCRCPNKKTDDCAHVWWFKFDHDGAEVRESTKQRRQVKAALVEGRRHTEVLDHGTGVGKTKAMRLKAHIEDYLVFARQDHPATAEEKDVRLLLPRPPVDPIAKVDKRRPAPGPSFLAVVGDKRLDQVTAWDIEKWRTARLKTPARGGGTVSRSTVNRDLNVIRGCFTKAIEWKRLKPAQSPFAAEAVENYDVDETEVRVLTAAERAIVLTKLPEPFSVYCKVTLEALLRIQEVLLLKRTDLGPASIQRRLKGGKVAAIPVSPTLVSTLRGFLTTPEQVYVFADANGEPPKPRSVASLMTKAFRAVGLHGVSHHVMRHTGVTDMLEDGISGKAIKEIAGWTSLRMLERYGHLRDAELLRATAGTAARNAAALADAARQAEAETAAAGQGAHENEGAQKRAHGGKMPRSGEE